MVAEGSVATEACTDFVILSPQTRKQRQYTNQIQNTNLKP